MFICLLILLRNKLVLRAIIENFILIYLQFRYYLDLSVFVFWRSRHSHGNCYMGKLKNLHMRKIQKNLKNQHAGNRPLVYSSVNKCKLTILRHGFFCLFSKKKFHRREFHCASYLAVGWQLNKKMWGRFSLLFSK